MGNSRSVVFGEERCEGEREVWASPDSRRDKEEGGKGMGRRREIWRYTTLGGTNQKGSVTKRG